MSWSRSSRTPDEQPATCPICSATIVAEPSVFIGDATCPRCDHLLWFIQAAESLRFFDARRSLSTKNRAIGIIARQLGVARVLVANNPTLFKDAGADSLLIVELIMELEQELADPE